MVAKTSSDFSKTPEGVNPCPRLIVSFDIVDQEGLISDRLYSAVASLEPKIQPCSTICCTIPPKDAAIGVAILVPLDDLNALFIESSKPSALAELIETPGATAKIPNVPNSVGPTEDDCQISGVADFVEAPTATTLRPFDGSNNCPPVLPGAIKERDHGTSIAHKSKSAVLSV